MNNNNDTTAIEGVVDVVVVVVETTNTINDAFVSESSDELSDVFKWTWVTIIQSIVLFFLAGVAEIIGGWMVWQAVRGDGGEKDTSNNNKKPPWWYAVIGSFVLIIYGFIPVFQPTSNFGRIYAVYGGVFIVLSYAFGWLLDGTKPDIGDISGGSIALIGVCVAMFWPRS